MKLFEYPTSSSSLRVRIALNLKGIAYESFCVDLAKEGGEHRPDLFRLPRTECASTRHDADDGLIVKTLCQRRVLLI